MRFFHGRHAEGKSFVNKNVYHEKFLRHRHGGSRGNFGGRGEGKRRFFERGEFKFALLELLALEPMHGYQLIKAMEEKTGGLYTPSAGSIYPNLQLLEDMTFIGCSETDGKKLYHITDISECIKLLQYGMANTMGECILLRKQQIHMKNMEDIAQERNYDAQDHHERQLQALQDLEQSNRRNTEALIDKQDDINLTLKQIREDEIHREFVKKNK